MKLKPVWSDMNPKAVTTDELFGFLHPATREWKDGMRVNIVLYVHVQKVCIIMCTFYTCFRSLLVNHERAVCFIP